MNAAEYVRIFVSARVDHLSLATTIPPKPLCGLKTSHPKWSIVWHGMDERLCSRCSAKSGVRS